ncbi:MAG TPA: hypothetical protein PKI61_03335 [bacterium]|nr:hypothetical protein [bacterium]HPT29556.1 hypothetical protein [bacterium]
MVFAKKMEYAVISSFPLTFWLFMAFACLINGIIQDHKLPPPPYASNVTFGEQKGEEWVKYCRLNG